MGGRPRTRFKFMHGGPARPWSRSLFGESSASETGAFTHLRQFVAKQSFTGVDSKRLKEPALATSSGGLNQQGCHHPFKTAPSVG